MSLFWKIAAGVGIGLGAGVAFMLVRSRSGSASTPPPSHGPAWIDNATYLDKHDRTWTRGAGGVWTYKSGAETSTVTVAESADRVTIAKFLDDAY